MKRELQKIGVIVVCIIIMFALYGMKTAYTNINHAVEVFDLTQVWKTWNTILVVIQVVGIIGTIYLTVELTSGKRFVLVEPQAEPDEVVEVWETDTDGWDKRNQVSKSDLPSEAEVLKELREMKGRGTVEFWARKEKECRRMGYEEAKMFCLSERKAAKGRDGKHESPSPTIEFALK